MRKITALIAFFVLCLSTYAAVDYNNTNLRNKISQMIIIGFDGTKLEKNSALYDDLANERISGVILFSNSPKDSKSIKNVKNPKQLKKLISDIKAASKSKLFISIDKVLNDICNFLSHLKLLFVFLHHHFLMLLCLLVLLLIVVLIYL